MSDATLSRDSSAATSGESASYQVATGKRRDVTRATRMGTILAMRAQAPLVVIGVSAAFLLLLVADVALCFYNGHPVQAYEQIVLAVLAVPSHMLGAKFGRKLRRRRQLKVTHLPTIPERH